MLTPCHSSHYFLANEQEYKAIYSKQTLTMPVPPVSNKTVHNYHDYSRVSELENELAKILEQPSNSGADASGNANRADLNFPVRSVLLIRVLGRSVLFFRRF